MEYLRKIFGKKSSISENPTNDSYQPPPEALEALKEEEANRRKAARPTGYPYSRGPLYGLSPRGHDQHHEVVLTEHGLDSHDVRDIEMAAAGDAFEGNTIEIIEGEAHAGMHHDDQQSEHHTDDSPHHED